MSINDGGPAFPRPASEYTKRGTLPDGNDAAEQQEGMSLRDWFAGQALQGLLSDSKHMSGISELVKNMHPGDGHEQELAVAQMLALRAYITADAMLQRRSFE